MRTTAMILLLFCGLFISGCRDKEDDADEKQREATARSMSEAQREIGMPAITNFQERRLMKQIFELRDQENLVTYAYIVNKMTGKLVFIGKCVGYGLPYSVQYTNPKRPTLMNPGNKAGVSQWALIDQPDPNGLFMPQGLSATWLMMVDPKGVARPVYVEPKIIVSPFPLHKD